MMNHDEPAPAVAPAPLTVRAAVAVLASGLLVLCLDNLVVAHHLLDRILSGHGGRTAGSRMLESFIYAACVEMLIAFAVMCALTIYWAAFQPKWADRAFSFVGAHVYKVFILFMVGFAAVAGVYALVVSG